MLFMLAVFSAESVASPESFPSSLHIMYSSFAPAKQLAAEHMAELISSQISQPPPRQVQPVSFSLPSSTEFKNLANSSSSSNPKSVQAFSKSAISTFTSSKTAYLSS
ncbi:hypothetical protein V8G54_023722 [Vigna mungo]|uniref:Uncharacterized protein n=1 Tax=Vigna mungo TaxID=3915 RepID=A0AAQ3N5W1_VIGMU